MTLWLPWLAPLALLPIALLFVFVGCQVITGIDEFEAAPPEPPPAPPSDVTFTYAALPAQVVRIGWQFDASGLVYPGGGGPPTTFNPGPYQRTRGGAPPLIEAGEAVVAAGLGAPTGGALTCECRYFLQGEVDPVLLPTVAKSVGDADFPTFELTADLQLL